jgi:hypothetical protein
MENLKDRQPGDSGNQVGGRLGGRGNRTPQGGLVHLWISSAEQSSNDAGRLSQAVTPLIGLRWQ